MLVAPPSHHEIEVAQGRDQARARFLARVAAAPSPWRSASRTRPARCCRRPRRCRCARAARARDRSARCGPGAGRKPASGSSAHTRASMHAAVLAPRERRSRRSPRAMRICSSTRSTPVISSVMPCSTCRRGFISRKKKSSPRTRNSTVPTPDVARPRAPGARRSFEHAVEQLGRQARRRRLFDHLLVPALHRAVAAAERDARSRAGRRRSAPRCGGRR